MLLFKRKMGRVTSAAALLATGVLCLAGAPAKADLRITQHTTMQTPAMQNMPQSMGSLMNMTMFISGKRLRYNTAFMDIIIDQGAKKMTMVNNMNKTYSVSALNPKEAQAIMAGPGGGMSGRDRANFKVVDTGKTSTVLGHKMRHYVMTMQMNNPNGGGDMTIHSDVYAATDLPTADTAAYSNIRARSQGKIHVAGIPLKTTTIITGGPMGTMTVTQTATSISTAPVPARVFAVPSNFTKTAQPSMPGMGAPGMGAPGMGGPPT